MHPPGAAARRFYKAFYQYALLNSTRTRQHVLPPATPIATPRHTIRTRASADEKKEQVQEGRTNRLRRGLVIKKHQSAPRGLDVRKHPSICDQRKEVDGKEMIQESKTDKVRRSFLIRKPRTDGVPRENVDARPPRYLLEPVQSPSERPSHDLKRFEEIVRHRSDESLTVELALPADKLWLLQRRWGNQLEGISERHGVSIEVRNLVRSHEKTQLDASYTGHHPVLFSGPTEDVRNARTNIDVLMKDDDPNFFAPFQSVSDPEVFKRLARDGMERPSNTLHPGDVVLRKVIGDACGVEWAVEEFQLRVWQRLFGDELEKLQDYHGIVVRVLERRSEEVGHGTNDETAYSITFAGHVQAINHAWRELHLPYDEGSEILTSPIRSKEEMPIQHITPEFMEVVRQRWKADMSLSMSLWESTYREIQKTKSIFKELKALGVKIRDGWYHPSLAGIRQKQRKEKACMVTLIGPYGAVRRARNALREMIQAVNSANLKTDEQQRTHSIAENKQQNESPSSSQGSTSGQADDRATTQNQASFVDEELEVKSSPARCRIWFRGAASKAIPGFIVDSKGSIIQGLKRRTNCTAVGWEGDRIVAHGESDAITEFVEAVKRRVAAIAKARTISENVEVRTTVWHYKIQRSPEENESKNMDPEEAQQLREDVRSTLRALTHPVVLITSRQPDQPTNSSDPSGADVDLISSRGVTVSSFTTVTMAPQPIISFNIKVPSRTWEAIQTSTNLRIHMLAASGRGASIADAFTKPYQHAHEGFVRLKDMGVVVETFAGTDPPRVHALGGVLAQMRAKILKDRCVKVGDHMIAVARVDSCRSSDGYGLKSAKETDYMSVEDMDGLSYSKGSYRRRGEQLDVGLVDARPERTVRKIPTTLKHDLNDDQATNTKQPLSNQIYLLDLPAIRQATSRPVDAEEEPDRESPEQSASENHPPEGPGVTNPIYDLLRGSKEAAAKGKKMKIFDIWDEVDKIDDEPDDSFSRSRCSPSTQARRQRPSSTTTDQSEEIQLAAADAPLWGPEDLAREESGRLASDKQPRAAFNHAALQTTEDFTSSEDALEATKTATPTEYNSLSISKRAYSTSSRIISATLSRRAFSTKSKPLQDTKDSEIDFSQVIEPDARKTTVADFLGVPDDNKPPKSHRVRRLVNMNEAARLAERRLVKEKDLLTDEERLELEHTIRTNYRVVTRQVAWNATGDLRLMLDKGRVDFKRARYLEGIIEKGLAVLIEEAKLARQMLEQKEMNPERFKSVRQRLQKDHETMTTETNRLRQFVDEDGGED